MLRIILITLSFASFPISLSSQTIDFAMEVCSGFCISDVTIDVCDGFCIPDETWEVLGACSNFPDISVEICDGFCISDATIEICDGFCIPDRQVCVSNARELDSETLKILRLID